MSEVPKVNDFQIEIGQKLGVDLKGETRKVAAAKILDEIARAIDFDSSLIDPSRDEPTEKQIEYAESAFGIDISEDTYRVALAKISDGQLKRNLEALDEKELTEGEDVIFTEEMKGKIIKKAFTISTIKPNGHIFFKGSNSGAAWAFQVDKIPDDFEYECKDDNVQFLDHRVD